MSEIRVLPREIESPDAQFLIKCLSDELAVMYETDEAEQQAFLKQIRSEEGSCFVVAYAEEKPVGCGMVRRLDTDTGEIKRMYVAKEVRGQGVGAKILRELEAQARQLGYHALKLETGVPQKAAIRLYQKTGYAPCPCYGHYADDPISVCFSKSLL